MIKLELPIYASVSKKKTVLLSMNWFRNAHFQTESKVKKFYHQLVFALLKKGDKLSGKIRVHYKLYYKNSKSDLMNVVNVVDKYLLDALQEAKIIENDNVLTYQECHIEVAGQDKINPRLVVILEGEND